jgi:nicotinamidase-related amidase
MKKIPISFPIVARRTAVVVVDMQELFCDPQGAVYVPDTANIIQPISDCIAAARKAGLPVIFLRHIVRGDGSDTGRMRDLYPTVDAMLARGLNPEIALPDRSHPQQLSGGALHPHLAILEHIAVIGKPKGSLDVLFDDADGDALVADGA